MVFHPSLQTLITYKRTGAAPEYEDRATSPLCPFKGIGGLEKFTTWLANIREKAPLSIVIVV